LAAHSGRLGARIRSIEYQLADAIRLSGPCARRALHWFWVPLSAGGRVDVPAGRINNARSARRRFWPPRPFGQTAIGAEGGQASEGAEMERGRGVQARLEDGMRDQGTVGQSRPRGQPLSAASRSHR
jgi:hypothetical protein